MPGSTLTGSATAAMVFWFPSPAKSWAHGHLARSFPGARMHLVHSRRHIDLLSSLMMDPGYSMAELKDDRATVLATKTRTRRSRRLSMDAQPLQPVAYHLVYRMLSPDGDPLLPRIDFSLDQ